MIFVGCKLFVTLILSCVHGPTRYETEEPVRQYEKGDTTLVQSKLPVSNMPLTRDFLSKLDYLDIGPCLCTRNTVYVKILMGKN